MTFSNHAIDTAADIIKEAPGFEEMFEVLKEFSERGNVADFTLVIESFRIKGSIHDLVEFADGNKKRDEIMEVLQWCATTASNREENGLDEIVETVGEWLREKTKP